MATKKYTRDMILKAAYELSRDIGFDGLSMRQIANKVGCSVMPLYESFSSKQELIDELSTFNEKLHDLSSQTMYDRYHNMLKDGLNYPTFWLSVVLYDVKRQHEEETIMNLCNLLKKDERLKNLTNIQVYRINTRIETFIVGIVYARHQFENPIRFYEGLKIILNQTIDAIVENYVKNI